MNSAKHPAIVGALLKHAHGTYAQEADVGLENEPAPLFRLLVFGLVSSTPISASIAVATARELRKSGMSSAPTVKRAKRSDIIEALGRAHYVRYDESTATRLHELADRVDDVYGNDLRRLPKRAQFSVPEVKRLLQEFNGIGPTGADIFTREVQAVWPWARPYFDNRAIESARGLGLPSDPDELAGYVRPEDVAELSAALVRISLDHELRASVEEEFR
ncbi:endonuclease [Rhodococcus sp. NPDC058521]|uniref:endonuclease n=1 Tax=Rhodococcus sp. NPDC058521 TaxID=3346536 RepID=UPI00365DF5D0